MGTPPTMSRDSGIRPALHRCPKCLHPMAPGEGVPDTRLGAFGRGIGTDCNECGFRVPEGARMLWGGSGAADDPGRTVAGRITGTFPAIVALSVLAVACALLGAWAMRGIGRFAGRPMIPVALACLVSVIIVLIPIVRLLRPALRDLRSGFAANRSTWLLGRGWFEEWKHGGSGAAEPRMVGPVLAISVRAESRGDALRVTALAADASRLGPGARASALPDQLLRMQKRRAILAGKPVMVMVGKVPTVQPEAVPPVTMIMHVPRGEPGFEDAGAAVGTVARACLRADPTAIPSTSARVDGRSWIAPTLLQRIGRALGSPTPPGSIGTSAEHWEADEHGFLAVERSSDGSAATAFGIPAAALAQLSPHVEGADLGTGHSMVGLTSGSKMIRGIAVAAPAADARAAAGRTLAEARRAPTA